MCQATSDMFCRFLIQKGKSLSVICSVLQWLKDAEARDEDENAVEVGKGRAESTGQANIGEGGGGNGDNGAEEPSSWLQNFTKDRARRDRIAKAKRIRERRRGLALRLQSVREKQRRGLLADVDGRGRGNAAASQQKLRRKRPHSDIRASGKGSTSTEDRETDAANEYLVAEYDSAAEADTAQRTASDSSSEDAENAPKRGWNKTADGFCRDDLGLRQVLYCSRTHSQTSQFVNEVKKTVFAEKLRCASIGSRRTLCGNESVSSLKSDVRMADACLELQKSKTKREGKRKSGMLAKKNKSKNLGHGRVSEVRQGTGADQEVGEKTEDAKTAGCPLLEAEGQDDFPYRALASVQDIEEVAELGRRDGICAYYGSRRAASLAQLVVMPYAALLSRESREATGISLDGAVVVIDEAHNLVEAITSVHSRRVTLSEIARAHSQLSQYEARYGGRLKGGNAFYVGNILRLLRVLMKYLIRGKDKLSASRIDNSTSSHASGPGRTKEGVSTLGAGLGQGDGIASEMLEINDFLFRTGIDNINIFKVQRYMRRSDIAKKVMGFLDLSSSSSSSELSIEQKGVSSKSRNKAESDADVAADAPEMGGAFVSRHIPALQIIEGFLNALTNASRDGRVLLRYGKRTREEVREGKGLQTANQSSHPNEDDEEPSIKFLMLNPAVHFDEVVKKARAVLLVGGTMQPIGDLVRQLFSSVPSDKIDMFSCGHVIPKENLLPLCVSRGPSGITFNFTYFRRGNEDQIDELGRLITNVCKIVPGGVVCFLASYGYLDQVLKRWKVSGTLRQLGKLKSVYSEPRSAKDVETVLRDFSLAAKHGAWKAGTRDDGGSRDPRTGDSRGGGGGLLMSVVGAKMSEGINFSDDLARCVVMVGLPYPDKHDPELQQKMAYLDAADPSSRGRAGREFYSNVCMRAVNQSIGRSIRHAQDYANILLVDERYHDDQVVRLLPGWIADRITKTSTFGQTFLALRRFFNDMRRKIES